MLSISIQSPSNVVPGRSWVVSQVPLIDMFLQLICFRMLCLDSFNFGIGDLDPIRNIRYIAE